MPSGTSDKDITLRGSCACGRITFESTAMPTETGTTICHCITCRKLSGGPFQTFTAIPSKEIVWYDQEVLLRFEGLPIDSPAGIKLLRLSDKADRPMCADCGSCLAMRYNYRPEQTYLALGCIDLENLHPSVLARLKPFEEIFCSQRASWFQSSAPCRHLYERMPPNMEDDNSSPRLIRDHRA